jgi:hypothetical protein
MGFATSVYCVMCTVGNQRRILNLSAVRESEKSDLDPDSSNPRKVLDPDQLAFLFYVQFSLEKWFNSCCLLVREVDAGDNVTSQSRRDLLTVGESGDYQPKSDATSGQQIVGKYTCGKT